MGLLCGEVLSLGYFEMKANNDEMASQLNTCVARACISIKQ